MATNSPREMVKSNPRNISRVVLPVRSDFRRASTVMMGGSVGGISAVWAGAGDVSKCAPLSRIKSAMKRYGLRVDSVSILAALAIGAAALAGCAAQSPTTRATTSSHPSGVVYAQPAASPAHPPSSGGSRAAAADVNTEPVIACFGDSLTAGLGIDRDQSYPAVLQRMLDEAGYHYRVVNEGVSGDTTKDGLERLNRVLAQKPQIVVLEFGGNDGLRGLPVRTAQQNLATMIEQLQHEHAKVALAGISLPPQYGDQYITQFDAMYPTLARQFHVPLLPFILQNVYGVEGDIQPDGVHPTAQGAKQVAANVEKLIRPLLKK